MARKKVQLAFITNDAARKSTYKRRKKGIIKKIWPESEGAKQVIQKYKNVSVLNQSKNVNQESFIMQMIVKAQNQLKQQRQENYEEHMTLSMFQYMQSEKLPDTEKELNEVNKLLEKKIKEIENKLAALKCESN